MMNEFDAHRMSPVETVKRQIWLIFNQLRKDGLGLEESHVMLLFISLYKDGIIEKDFIFNTNVHYQNNIDDSLTKTTDKSSIEYQEIIQIFSDSILKLHGKGFNRLIDSLIEINRETLAENFQEIFESILFRISKSLGRFGGEFIQPVELTRLISVLADLPRNAKVFNPFAGLGSFGVYIDDYQYYLGQELNPKTWAVGALRLMAFGKQGNTNYVRKDSILNWPDESQKFDLIVSTPPFGMRLGGFYRTVEPGIVSIEQFLIEKSLKSLDKKGKSISLLPQGFLFRGSIEQQYRKFLIDEDLIESIISLPAGLLINTGTPLAILIINKDKKVPGKVQFIQAEKYFISISPKEKVFDVDAFNRLIKNGSLDDEEIRIVDNQQIRTLNYNLSVPRYFQKNIEGVRLGEFLEPLTGQRSNLPMMGKLVRISNLKDDKLDFQLNLSSIEDTELVRSDLQKIEDSCLLLAIRFKTLKPTIFEYEGQPIFKGHTILTFKINEARVDKAYLINELHAEYVQEQLGSIRMGGTIPFIRRSDLMDVVIKLPDLKEQKAKVSGINEAIVANKVKEAMIEARKHGVYRQYFQELSALKHALGGQIFKLTTGLTLLKKAIIESENGGTVLKLSSRLSESSLYTINDQFQSFENTILHISKLLERADQNLNLENFSLIPIDISHFFVTYIHELKLNYAKSFECYIESSQNEIDPFEYGKVFIQADIDLLKIFTAVHLK